MSLIAIIFFIVLACIVVAVLILAGVIYYKKYYLPRHASKPTTNNNRASEVNAISSDGLQYENPQIQGSRQNEYLDNDVYEPYRYVNRAMDVSPPSYYDVYQDNCFVNSNHTHVKTVAAYSPRNEMPIMTFV